MEAGESKQYGGKSAFCEWGLVSLLIIGLTICFTWPLAYHFTTAIPYTHAAIPGYEHVPAIPGDHMQFYYWCWLLVDNLLGPSAFYTNPYEFNTFLSAGIPGFANFPFSLIYLLFYPLGAVTAYNCMVMASYLLTGLASYALAREVLQNRLAALLVAVILPFLPFRAAQVASGHLYGFVIFLFPLALFCMERGFRRASAWWGAGAGLCLLAMSLMEGHLIYYTCLFMGVYAPLRLAITAGGDSGGASSGDDKRPAAWPVILAGLSLGLTAHLMVMRKTGAEMFSPGLAEALGVYLTLVLAAWLLMARLLPAVTLLSARGAGAVLSRSVWPLWLTPLYAVQFWLDAPHLGAGVLAAAALVSLALALPRLWRQKRLPGLPAGWWAPLWPLALCITASAGRMLYVKSRTFDGSIAGKGRGLDEVLLFSPRLGDLFDPANPHVEQLVHPGWLLMALMLAALILLALFKDRSRTEKTMALWAGLGALTALLSLGPTLQSAPLYGLLYKYVPFFNFPRVPGRLILIAVPLLSLAGGWALARGLKRLESAGWGRGLFPVAASAVLMLAVWDQAPHSPTGLCLMPPGGEMDRIITAELGVDKGSGKRLLELPIWPGDSHQSSRYELTISRTRARSVNGYSPVVPRAYVEQIYRPLDSLNHGIVSKEALAVLKKLEPGFISFHNDDRIYTRKISPFPPTLAQERLMALKLGKSRLRQGNVLLISPGLDQTAPGDARWVTSPVTSLWEAESLPRNTGGHNDDKNAGGWGLMFEEADEPGGLLGPRYARAGGNVITAREGRDKPGYLVFGPYRAYPPGDYTVRFRLRRKGDARGHVDVATDQGRGILARAELDGASLPADSAWRDLALKISLDRLTPLEFRVRYDGGGELSVDAVMISFKGREKPEPFYAASELWRQTGELTDDKGSPTGLACMARAGYHPPLYLMHGPQATLEPGRYLAGFWLSRAQGPQPGGEAAILEAATDLGRVILNSRRLRADELGDGFKEYKVEFEVKRRLEAGFRVRFLEGASLILRGVSLKRLP